MGRGKSTGDVEFHGSWALFGGGERMMEEGSEWNMPACVEGDFRIESKSGNIERSENTNTA